MIPELWCWMNSTWSHATIIVPKQNAAWMVIALNNLVSAMTILSDTSTDCHWNYDIYRIISVCTSVHLLYSRLWKFIELNILTVVSNDITLSFWWPNWHLDGSNVSKKKSQIIFNYLNLLLFNCNYLNYERFNILRHNFNDLFQVLV